MSKSYIINTNKSNDLNCEADMLKNKKCAAYYSPWKEGIDKIQVHEFVFLYSNGNGIIARGVATGVPEIQDYQGKMDEEHYMELDRFKTLSTYLKPNDICTILNKNIVFAQTQISLDSKDGLKLWQYITKNCI